MVPPTLVHLLLLSTLAVVIASPLPGPVDSSLVYLDSRTDSFVDPTIVYPFKSRSADIYGATLDVRAAEDAVYPPAACQDICFGGTSANIPTCQVDQESVACACSPEAISEFQQCFACVEQSDPTSTYLAGPDGTQWSAEQWAGALTESCADPAAMESVIASPILPSATESVVAILASATASVAPAPTHHAFLASSSGSGSAPASLASSATVIGIDIVDPTSTGSAIAALETDTASAATTSALVAALTTTTTAKRTTSNPTTSSKFVAVVTATTVLSAANVGPATLSGLVSTATTSVAVVLPTVSAGAAEPSVNHIPGPSQKGTSAGKRQIRGATLGWAVVLGVVVGSLGAY